MVAWLDLRMVRRATHTFTAFGCVLVVGQWPILQNQQLLRVTEHRKTGTVCDKDITSTTDGVCWAVLADSSYLIVAPTGVPRS